MMAIDDGDWAGDWAGAMGDANGPGEGDGRRWGGRAMMAKGMGGRDAAIMRLAINAD